jgi:YVTN family beta-propeller protein
MKKKLIGKSIGLVFLSSVMLAGCGGSGDSAEVPNGGAGEGDGGDDGGQPPVQNHTSAIPGRSTTIALTSDDRRLVVVNRQKNSVSIIQVKDESGADNETLLAEVPVGREPRFVAISPDDSKAFVTNAVDGTVSVIDLSAALPQVLGVPIKTGTEPRGIALSPNGAYAYVANHTAGTVTVISTSSLAVVNTVTVGGNPMALAITNDGDTDDHDEQVFVTRFYSEVIDPVNRPDGFNDSKQGKVKYFSVQSSLTAIPAVHEYNLAPLANAGFAADRRHFCLNTREALQANGDVVFFNSGVDSAGNGAAALANTTFCPDINSTDASAEGPIAKTPQGAYTNYLYGAMIRHNTLFIPNVGASPEPPVKFSVNVQALVSSIDLATGKDTTINLNNQIKTETQPASPTESLDRLFGNDIVAIEANPAGDQFLVVSRGGNYVMRATLGSDGNLDIGAATGVVRFQTGNIPSGVVMSLDGKRAYANNEVNTSVTSIDLESNQVLTRDIASSEPPAPGTQKHRNLLGKLVFYTALGTPDTFDTNADGVFDVEVRDIDPLQFRGKASDNAWSGCVSCHEDGHADNVTWIFPTGPRQTIPLEGMFADGNSLDQRILNWSGVQGSVTDFNNNARGVQGGVGFATNVNGVDKSAQAFNHGPVIGVSDALDAMSEWVANAVKAPIMPDNADTMAMDSGRHVFESYCSSCHGGAKWTKSTIAAYENNPTFATDPLGANFFAQGNVKPLDPDLVVAGPQIRAVDNGGVITSFLDNVGTLNAAGPLELRGAGAIGGGAVSIEGDPNEGVVTAKQSTQGFAALGGIGFNTPSLLGVALSAPYLHDGSAVTLSDVFARHQLPAQDGATIQEVITDPATLGYLEEFLLSIDAETPPVN